jgi:TonB family protein
MLRRLIFLFAILPAAAFAGPQENPNAITVTSKAPPPSAVNAVPPPPPEPLRGTGHPHTCLQNYPEAAVKAGIEGTTTLSFRVTAQGTVTQVNVAKSSGNADLDDAAVACASTWTYQPATNDGVPVEVRWQAVVAWKLHDASPMSWVPSGSCTKFAAVSAAMLKGIPGRSWIGYRVVADGTAISPVILASSGNTELDRAAVRCVAGHHFILDTQPIPPAGLMQDIMVDWNYELAASK